MRVSSTAGVHTQSPPETTKIPTAVTVPFPLADETPITVAPSGVVYGSLKTCTLAKFDRSCSSVLRVLMKPPPSMCSLLNRRYRSYIRRDAEQQRFDSGAKHRVYVERFGRCASIWRCEKVC